VKIVVKKREIAKQQTKAKKSGKGAGWEALGGKRGRRRRKVGKAKERGGRRGGWKVGGQRAEQVSVCRCVGQSANMLRICERVKERAICCAIETAHHRQLLL